MTTTTTKQASKIKLGATEASSLLKRIGYEGGDLTIQVEIKGGSYESSECAGTVRISANDWIQAIKDSGKFDAVDMQDILSSVALNCKARTLGEKRENEKEEKLLKQLSKLEEKAWKEMQDKREKASGKLPHWSKRLASCVGKTIPAIKKRLLKFDTITGEIID